MAAEIKRPVALCGENPCITLYAPDSDEKVAVAAYWRVTYSPAGTGNVVILWQPGSFATQGTDNGAGIYTDNRTLAAYVSATFSRNFDEFKGLNIEDLDISDADITQELEPDGSHYISCSSEMGRIRLSWTDVLDRRLLLVPGFDNLGSERNERYHLSTVICPCGAAEITIDGHALAGSVRTTIAADRISSSAFLAFCETWVREG